MARLKSFIKLLPTLGTFPNAWKQQRFLKTPLERGRRVPCQLPAQGLEENEDLKGVLPTVYSGLESDLLVNLLKLFGSVPMDIEGDVFGKIYEYFLGNFAMEEGRKGSEFFTPTSIVKLKL